MGFVYAMRDFLPDGLKGLLLVAFFSAYMSTISTQLNWGSSYLVNDLYKRFIYKRNTKSKMDIQLKQEAEDKHFVWFRG
jgi:SSS family solute:Na+ symporter